MRDQEAALTAIRKKQFRIHQPSAIAKLIAGQSFRLDRTGLSGSTVAIFEDMVVKSEIVSEESENHLAMLRWLEGILPVPRVIESAVQEGSRWTLMTRISGEMSCADRWRDDPHRLVKVLAEAMKLLWTVDVSGCPVDQSAEAKLRRAGTIVENGQVDMDLADPETFGEKGFPSPAALLR